MLARTRRVPTLAAALALGLTTAAGVAGTAAAGTAPTAGAPTAPNHALAAPRTSTLPNGDRVVVTGTGPAASVMVQAPDGRTVPAVRFAPDPHHAYVIPASVLAHPAQLTPAQYQIAALSAPGAPAATPYYPLDILQINAVGLDGKAADATTFLTDTDDIAKSPVPIPVAGGIARVAVPIGHYVANTIYGTYNPATGVSTTHVVTQLDITVAAGGVTTLNADERAATAQVTGTAPKPAVTDFEDAVYGATDAQGKTGTLSVIGDGGLFAVSPVAKPQNGGFSFQLMGWGGESPAGSPDAYRYDVMFPPTDHVDANQTYQVDASKLTTVHNTVDTDAGESRHQGEYMMGPYSPEFGGFAIGHLIPVPEHLTTYTGAPVGDTAWMANVITALPSPTSGFPAALLLGQDGPAYQGKAELWRTWGHGPLTAQAGQYRFPTGCRSCADGGTVDLGLNPLVDSNPDTTVSFLGPASGHLSVYRDGNQVFSQDNTSGTELTGQAQQPGTYRMVFDLDLSQFPITQSTVTHTDVTVPYTPAPDPKWTLPAGNTCQAQGTGTTPCSILPVLNLNYLLATDDTNTSHGPVSVLALTVGHQSYGPAGSNAAATGATVSVSFDKGATWTPATIVPAGPNHFVALWKNGAKGGTPWLKVTATDALGGSITQTVANAYTVG